MSMVKSNQHRIGKNPFQAYLTDAEKAMIEKAKKKGNVKTNRELIVWLSLHYLANP